MKKKSKIEVMIGGHGDSRKSRRLEIYLETIHELEQMWGIARIMDIAEALGVKPSTVTKMINKMSKIGLVEYEKYRGVRLTSESRKRIAKLNRKHRVLASFFRSIGLPDLDAEVEAEKLEHVISDKAINKLDKFMKKIESCKCPESG